MLFLSQNYKLMYRKRCFDLLNFFTSDVTQTHNLTNLKFHHRLLSNKCDTIPQNFSLNNPEIRDFLERIIHEQKNNGWNNSPIFKEIGLNLDSRDLFIQRENVVESLKSLDELASDDREMQQLRNDEEIVYKTTLNSIDEQLLNEIINNIGKEYYERIILEISSGAGGQEAMLFVRDLYDMYLGYLNYLNLDYEIMDEDVHDTGGFRHVSLLISGSEAFEFLKYEGGVHRVQRIPATEKSGRVHTSTVSVVVLPEPRDIDIAISENDLVIETMKASGAGGQHVNTTDSAVRVIHKPSGVIVTCQTDRSQHKNKEKAIIKLKTKLYEMQLNEQIQSTSNLRSKQQGMKNRNEKIRTYNYNQNRITDHRLQNGTVHSLKDFMQGGSALREMNKKLQRDYQQKILMQVIRNYKNH